MGNKSIGKHFRPVVIDKDLRHCVDDILRSDSCDDPKAVVARRRIREMSSPEKAYLFASEMRTYLEEKTQIGREKWAFPAAGDMFLDALEWNLPGIGPNFFRDHYSGMVGCYRNGYRPTDAIEGSLYCIDLALQKTMGLFLDKERGAEDPEAPLSFVVAEESGYKLSMSMFQAFAEQFLHDAVQTALELDRSEVPRAFLDYVIEGRPRIEQVIKRWERLHNDPGLASLSDGDYLAKALEVAEETEYTPLTAMVKEQLGVLHEKLLSDADSRTRLHASIHPLYEAGILWLQRGNKERTSEAYGLSIRHHNRSAAMFSRIDDRTSIAKALVERARTFVKKGDDPELIRTGLFKAVCLVMAHVQNLPHGTLPTPTDEQVTHFLKRKGYGIEADAYEDAVRRHEE